METTLEQLSINIDGYKQIADSGAFKTLEDYFMQSFLQQSHGQKLDELGQNYLYQSGALSVFRTIKDLATGINQQDLVAFEDEVLEDDTDSLLD